MGSNATGKRLTGHQTDCSSINDKSNSAPDVAYALTILNAINSEPGTVVAPAELPISGGAAVNVLSLATISGGLL